jgi:hypothetical protein
MDQRPGFRRGRRGTRGFENAGLFSPSGCPSPGGGAWRLWAGKSV